eukprot:1195372-Prorocentrum_minimum.AAC.9
MCTVCAIQRQPPCTPKGTQAVSGDSDLAPSSGHCSHPSGFSASRSRGAGTSALRAQPPASAAAVPPAAPPQPPPAMRAPVLPVPPPRTHAPAPHLRTRGPQWRPRRASRSRWRRLPRRSPVLRTGRRVGAA